MRKKSLGSSRSRGVVWLALGARRQPLIFNKGGLSLRPPQRSCDSSPEPKYPWSWNILDAGISIMESRYPWSWTLMRSMPRYEAKVCEFVAKAAAETLSYGLGLVGTTRTTIIMCGASCQQWSCKKVSMYIQNYNHFLKFSNSLEQPYRSIYWQKFV